MDKKYPEAEKWSAVADRAAAIDEFVEWLLFTKNYQVYPSLDMYNLIYEFFKIDTWKLEEERQEMIEMMRNI